MTNSVKFYWNGLRLNGEKALYKCSYSLDNHRDHKECVTLYADHCRLPRDLFEVVNETDIYTDYFDSDHATLTPDHPLYKYARFAAVKAEIRSLKSYIKHKLAYMEKNPAFAARYNYADEVNRSMKQLAALEAIEDPGQPGEDDLKRIAELRLEAENARIAAQQEAKQKAREAMLARKNAGRHYINDVAKKYPIRDGEPVVTINWSEHPAFYSWDDGELKLSVAAAEIILTHFDKEVHAEQDRGYDKTSFTIEYVNEDGEQDTYEGRYDLGDNDGGMIEHIRAFGSRYMKMGRFGNNNPSDEDKEIGKAIVEFAEMLQKYAAVEGPQKFYMVEVVYWPSVEMVKSNTFIAIAGEKPQATTVKDGDAFVHRVYFEDPVEAEDYRQRMMADYSQVMDKGGDLIENLQQG